MSENKHTPEPLCPAALPFAITDQEMKDLMRFHECAMDDEGYDVPKDRMKRLAEIGLLRRVSANYYEHTTFGLAVINGEFEPADTIRQQRDELNVELAAEKESHASAYADALRQAEHLGRSVARIAELEKQRDGLRQRIASLESDLAEQCRLHGIASEREARKDARIAELERMRDGLLAALRHLLNAPTDPDAVDQAFSAIASVKGGAA